MTKPSRTISRAKGVELCTDLLFSGQKTGDIVRMCEEKYGVSRSAVEKWIQLARPKVEILRQQADIAKQKAIEEEMADSAKRLNITRDAVLEKLWGWANGNIQDFFQGKTTMTAVKDLPKEIAANLASVEVDELYHGTQNNRYWVGQTRKIRLHDPLKALDMIIKMQGWYKDEGKPAVTNITIGYGKEVPV
jgi:Terminase small subunit